MCVCLCVCVSCLCRPPSHWWISFIFYTIIGLDPEGGQWLFKFKSNHNKKCNRQNAKQYMWDCSINLWNRKHTNSRVFTPELGDSLTSVASVTRAHSNCVLWDFDCFHWLNSPKITRVHGNATYKSWRLAYTAMQLTSSNFRSWARYKLSKVVLRGY